MRPHPGLVLFLIAALAGLFFTGWSTLDFVQHLDRQTHSLHCSFVPGLAAPTTAADSGCHVALMSPYSSWFRGTVWGGIPAALSGMAVFAFLVFRGLEIWFNRRQLDASATVFLLGATTVPVLTSLVYGGIAIFALDAFCKLCLGIYLSSLGTMIGAAWLWATASRLGDEEEQRTGMLGWGVGVAEGFGFVGIAIGAYLLLGPDFSGYVGACGSLPKPEDVNGVLVPFGGSHGGIASIEVLDPLCPSCKAFEDRLVRSGLDQKLDRKAVLFPLDSTCNWNVTYAEHPGACTVSEAVLCAGDKADRVLEWAFKYQDDIKERATDDPKAAQELVLKAFPELTGCVGSEKARQRLNRALRWASANQLPVLTPQLYVNNTKLCDEDVDLGLEWSLSQLIDHTSKSGTADARTAPSTDGAL
jgi:uncharacterized membrane protein